MVNFFILARQNSFSLQDARANGSLVKHLTGMGNTKLEIIKRRDTVCRENLLKIQKKG